MQSQWDERYQPADAEIVKRIAKRMSGRNGFGPSDVEDIVQDLAGHVSMQMYRFDPSLGSREKFVSKVAKNRLLNLIEKRTAKKRDARRNVEYEQCPPEALLDGSITADRMNLRLDLKEVVASMPPDVQEAFELRLAGHSEAELEALMHRTRGQVRTLMNQMARVLAEAGFDPTSDKSHNHRARRSGR